jgi:hypothetical protein
MTVFSELLATKHSLTIKIQLSPIVDNGVPICAVRINDSVEYYGQLLDSITLVKQLSLLEIFDIKISMLDKRYSEERETAVVIKSILIDDFEIIPHYTHLIDYDNDHNYNRATSYLGFNGTWRLSIDRPFYQWRHQVTNQGWLLT